MKTFRTVAALAVLLATSIAAALGVNGTSTSLSVVNAASNAGACTALSCAQVNIQSPGSGTIFTGSDAKYSTIGIQISGTWSGSLAFQASQDEGATWFTLPVFAPLTSVNGVVPLIPPIGITATTANGNWYFPAGGYTAFRVVFTVYTSGTAVVTLEQQTAIAGVAITQMPQVSSGNSQRVSYDVTNTETVPTAAQALQAVEADGTNILYLRHLKVCLAPTALQTTAGLRTLVLYKTTAASAAGSTSTPTVIGQGDPAFGGVARTGALTTTPAIGSVTTATSIANGTLGLGAAVATQAATNTCWEQYFGDAQGQLKPPSVSKAVTSGFAIGDLTGGAGGAGSYVVTMDVDVEAQ